MITIENVFLMVILPFISGALASLINFLSVTKEFSGFSKRIEDGKVLYQLGYWQAVITGGFVGLIGVHLILPEDSLNFRMVLITAALTGVSGVSFLLRNAIGKHKATAETAVAQAKALQEINSTLLEPIDESDNPHNQKPSD